MKENDSVVVMKFGGAALQDISYLKKSCDIIELRKKNNPKLVVVVSAMGKTTDFLIQQSNQISIDPPKRELDMLLSAGERISMALVAMELQKRGMPAHSFTGSQAGIITNDCHFDAKIVNVTPYRIQECLSKGVIPVIAGFQGVSLKKEITTLGRGGSDTTAVALGVALKAKAIEFYKDVPGIFTEDPKLTPDASILEDLNYDQAEQIICKSSKKLLHPRGLRLAKKNGIPLFICSFEKQSSHPQIAGSWIRDQSIDRIKQISFESDEDECRNYSLDLITAYQK